MTKLSFFVGLIVVFCIYVAGFLFGFLDSKLLRSFVNEEFRYSLNLLPIENVRISAPFQYTSEVQIKNILIKAGIQKANFFSINMSKIIRSLEKNPWIKDVQITRVWPNRVNINYKENAPLAYLNQDKIIIKDNCKVVALPEGLTKNLKYYSYENLNDDQILPFLVGDEKNTKKLCDTLVNIEIYVKPINNRIKKLVFSRRNSIYLELDNGITVLLGKNNILERFKRFVSFISKKGYENLIVSKDAKVDYPYIDMRYHNGLAVGTGKGINLTELMETA